MSTFLKYRTSEIPGVANNNVNLYLADFNM